MLGLFRFRNLAVKFSLSILGVTLIIGATATYWYLQRDKETRIEDAKVQLDIVAEMKALQLESHFAKHKLHIEDLSRIFTEQVQSHTNQQSWESVEKATLQETATTYFIDESATVFASPTVWQENMGEELDLDNNLFYNVVRDSLERAQNGRWTAVYYDDVIHQWLMTFAKPVYRQDEFIGVFGGGVNIDPIIEQLKNAYRRYQVEFFIHDEAGNIVYHPDYGARLLRQVDVMNLSVAGNKLIRKSLNDYINSNQVGAPVSTFVDWGKNIFAVSKKVESNGWVVVTYRSEQSVLKPWDSNSLTLIGYFTAWAVFMWFLLQFVAKSVFSNRLRETSDTISNFELNETNVFDGVDGEDEVDELHKQLNKLYQKILTRISEKSDLLAELKGEADANKALAQAVSYSDSAVILLELDYTISYVDTKSLSLLKAEREQLMEERFFGFIHEHMAFISEQIVNEIRRKSSWHGELVLKDCNAGGQVWVNTTITPMRDENSAVTKYVVSMQDISFIKDSQSKIEKLAYTDELTNLANRTFFIAQLEKLVEISKRGRYEFALLYFDIDDFKRVNDIYGHDGGDQLLMELAARLSQHLRNEDVLARMGGDEFALIVGGISSEQDVLVIANSILDAVNEPFLIRGAEVQSGTSIGITLSTTDEKDPELLLQHADLAMYEAKGIGKNTYQFYTKELNEAAKERQIIETALQVAINNSALELHYQPKVDFVKKKLVGYEALVRWNDAELGFVSPAKFIPIAEQSSLILQLGSWVLEEACRFAASLPTPVPVSINLSARQFESGKFVHELQQTMENCRVLPEHIEMEITESHLVSDVEDAIRQLHAIKQLGVSISIDDFGTGYSSLSYLKRFPVDTLKIDRSFIKDIPDDSNDVEITGAIIAMAQKLGLAVIAEGVETQEQVDFLENNGCHYVQGYFYSKPLTESLAREWKFDDKR